MNFTPKNSSIGQMFQSEYFYEIPTYQRRYVWRDEKIKNLWEDILFNLKEKGKISYFLGSFIIQKNKHQNNLTVIDGQQRLTTILLLNFIICKNFIKLNDEFNLKETLKYCILGNKTSREDCPRIINNDYPIIDCIYDYCTRKDISCTFEDYLNQIPYKCKQVEKRLVSCFNILNDEINHYLSKYKKCDRIKSLEELRDSLLKIAVIEIIVEDEKSASLVFETINARGQTLELHELIKNYLYMYEKQIKRRSFAREKWETILGNVDNIKGSTINKFISQYSTFEFGKQKQKDIFDVFKKNTPKNKANDRLVHLLECSEIYKNIVLANSDNYNKKINYLLKAFVEMDVSIIRPLLLSLLMAYKKNHIDTNSLIKYLTKLKNFFAIFVCIGENKTNEVEKIIYEYAYDLNKNFNILKCNELISKFKDKLISFDKFKNSFIKFGFTNHKNLYETLEFKSNKKKCQFILKEYELNMQNNDDYVISSFSIEHIKDDVSGGNACFIGNLTPLQQKENNKLKNKSMEDKIIKYKDSCFMTTRKLSENPKIQIWNDEAIENRSKALAKKFYEEIWIV